jgi:repressor LexA
MVNGDATVKRFFREKSGRIRLQPANERMQPIFVKEKDFASRGRVVAIVRKYR